MNAKTRITKVFVAIPCMDSIPTATVDCLLKMQSRAVCSFNLLAGSLIFNSREQLMDKAISQDADYIMWLDSDMTFDCDIIDKLLDNKKDFCAGICFRRREPFTPVLYKTIRMGLTREDTVTEGYDDYPLDSIFEVDACGFGGVLTSVPMLKDIKEKCGSVFIPIPGYGEDISACLRAKKLGYSVWCDSRVKLGHLAQTVMGEETFQELRRRALQNGATINNR